MKMSLFLRWSWRDLRERWLQVSAIALIIALGTGVYAGLGSSTPWREKSYDDSYAMLNMYDLRVRLTEGSYLEGDEFLSVVKDIPHADWIEAAEVRLLAPTLVEVQDSGETILVPGRLIGMRSSTQVNGIDIKKGQSFTDAGQDQAVLEYLFAKHYDLPAEGTVTLSGGIKLNYVGQGMTPEYFMVIANEVGFMDEANFAVVMSTLETIQNLTEHPDQVNDLVLTLKKGANQKLVQSEIEQALGQQFPEVGITLMQASDDPAYDMLYSDLEGDDQIFKLIAYLFLAGAVLGTFNLASRIVEAQRRQIGIGMALGAPRHLLAVRPLLVGAQIACLGVFFGILIGILISYVFADFMRDILPMPVFDAPFQTGIFTQAAVLGVLLPFAATLYPVWRAVRVQPIDAIKTGYLVAKGGGLAPKLAAVPLPGKSFTQMPLRNLLRAPRRTLLTLLGVAVAITTLIAMLGLLDSFFITIDQAEDEFLQDHPDRMIVTLNSFYPADSQPIEAIRQLPELSMSETAIQVGGELRRGDTKFEVAIELLDLNSKLWTPTITDGQAPVEQPGILINEKAANDLGVDVGDKVTLKHPQRESTFSYRMVETEITVVGIHASPLRFQVFMDHSQASLIGIEGLTNILYVNPAQGVGETDVKRALFNQPGVASTQTVASFTEVFEKSMDMLIGFMSVVVVAVMALAFLIAFNTTSINVDERAREIATLFAFGLPIRTVTRMTMTENLATGILGTIVGLILGFLTLTWLMNERINTMLPDVSMTITLSALSLIIAVILGVVVVALTPLLSVRKMSRMNLPSTLRVME